MTLSYKTIRIADGVETVRSTLTASEQDEADEALRTLKKFNIIHVDDGDDGATDPLLEPEDHIGAP